MGDGRNRTMTANTPNPRIVDAEDDIVVVGSTEVFSMSRIIAGSEDWISIPCVEDESILVNIESFLRHGSEERLKGKSSSSSLPNHWSL